MSLHFKNFVHGSILSLIGAITIGLLNYLIRRFMANGLPVESYGFFYSALAFCSLCIAVTEFGTKPAGTIMITKFLATGRKRHANATFSIIFLFNLLMGLLVALALALSSQYLMKHFFKYENGMFTFFIFLIFIVASSIESLMRTGLVALKDFFNFNLVNIVRTVIMFACIWLFLSHFQLEGAAVIFTIAIMLSGFLAYKLINRRIELVSGYIFSKKIPVKIFSLCSWMTISNTGLSIMYYTDTVCLTGLSTLNEVALYNIALPLMQLTMGLIVFPGVFVPIASELWQLRKYREIRRYCMLVDGCFLLSLPIVIIGGYYIAPFAITLLFGKQFIGASTALVWLWVGMIFYAIAQFNMSTLDTGNMQKVSAIAVTASMIINIIFNLLLIPKFGINGAAAATAFAYLSIAVFTALWLHHKLKNSL